MKAREHAYFFHVEALPSKELLRGIRLKSVNLETLMMTFVDYAADAVVPPHHHRREQITYVLEGSLEVRVNGEKRVLGPGEGVRIPPGLVHGSRPIEGLVKAVDAWTPLSERFKVERSSTYGEQRTGL